MPPLAPPEPITPATQRDTPGPQRSASCPGSGTDPDPPGVPATPLHQRQQSPTGQAARLHVCCCAGSSNTHPTPTEARPRDRTRRAVGTAPAPGERNLGRAAKREQAPGGPLRSVRPRLRRCATRIPRGCDRRLQGARGPLHPGYDVSDASLARERARLRSATRDPSTSSSNGVVALPRIPLGLHPGYGSTAGAPTP